MCYSVQGEEQVEVLRDVLLCSGRGAGGGSARCASQEVGAGAASKLQVPVSLFRSVSESHCLQR